MDKINKSTIEAQNKLSDIMTAINREKLIIETLIKDKNIIIKEIENISKEVSNIKSEEDSIKKEFESLKIKNKEDLKITEEKINIKKVELETLLNSIKTEESNLENSKITINKNISDLQLEYSSEEIKFKEKINGFKDEENLFTDKILELKKIISSLNSEVFISQNKIEENNKTIKEKEYTSSEFNSNLEIKKEHSAFLNNEIKEWNEKIDGLIVKYEDIKKLIPELVSTKEILEKEILELSLEKDNFVKDKFSLARDREVLNNREEFIKEKYQSAGILYS